jgi:hypothetical protein
MRTIALCFLLLSAADTFRSTVIAQARLAKETHWAWVHTGPLFDSWEVITGKAIVTVEGASFSAKLFDSEDPTLVRFTLTGTIRGEQIAVQAVREQSDVELSNYSGKMVTRRFQGFRDYAGVQTIVLSDGSVAHFGLTRSLPRQP